MAEEPTEGVWRVESNEPLETAPAASPEDLTYSNPFGQEVEKVWFDGTVVFAIELGKVDLDPQRVKVAQEYQVVYAVELGENGKPLVEPDRVEGQTTSTTPYPAWRSTHPCGSSPM